MRNKTAHLLALFLVVYIGVEVIIGGIICSLTSLFNQSLITVTQGLIVTFLVLVHGGGPSSGYVSIGGKYLSNLCFLMLNIFFNQVLLWVVSSWSS